MSNALSQALQHHQRGELDAAESIYRQILATSPRHPDALNLLGCVELARGDRDRAIPLIERAVAVAPRVPIYHENLAEAYYRSGRIQQAESECRRALALDPARSQALNRLGLIAIDRRDYEAALEHLSRALRHKPAYPEAMSNLAIALNRVGDHALARKYCELSLQLDPTSPVAWNNLGMAFKGLGMLPEAKQAFEGAGDFPIARFNLGYVHLLEDDLAAGLPLCEWRKQLVDPGEGLERPEWDGQASGQRLLVVHEQGLGDTILMSQFFVPLLERFPEVAVLVPPSVERLVAAIDPQLDVRTELGDLDYDFWCGTMSLPLRLGVDRVEKIPRAPWLSVPPERPATARPRIGINWAGNPAFPYDRVRSTRLEVLAPLLEISGVEWVSLHKGIREDDAERFGLPQPLREARDFHETARVLAGLDMVVSTETAVPNLSAALGIPTCVLTAVDYDWRWRSWYQDVQVCRQASPGDWPSAVAQAVQGVQDRLERWNRSGKAMPPRRSPRPAERAPAENRSSPSGSRDRAA